jgi:hypothetical protein
MSCCASVLAYKRPTKMTVSTISITFNSIHWMDSADVIINFGNAREFDMIEKANGDKVLSFKNLLFQNIYRS